MPLISICPTYDDDLGNSEFFLGKIKTLLEVLNNENT